jgi:hypothetical protein
MQWHECNLSRWQREKAIASKLLNTFESGIDEEGRAFFTGVFHIYSQHGHLYESVKLRFVYPPTFPKRGQPPEVYLESHQGRWEKSSNSHIESDWRLCLFVPGESGIDFTNPDSLNDLFAVLHTYLVKQRIFQRRLVRQRLTGEPAYWPGEERSHGIDGIREAIGAMGKIGRNAPCPCGSGKKYKRCHLDTITR